MCGILIWFWLSFDWTIFLTKLTIKYCVPRINSVFFNLFSSAREISNVSIVAILSEHGSQCWSSVCSRTSAHASQIAGRIFHSYFRNSCTLFGAIYHWLGKLIFILLLLLQHFWNTATYIYVQLLFNLFQKIR